VRRLFSRFARGSAGVGLLLLRVAAGSIVVARGICALRNTVSTGTDIFQLVVAAAALLFIIGLWTPAAAAVLISFELWQMVSRREYLAVEVLLCTVALAIALLGPGACSVDARLFGWKRLDIDTGNKKR